MTGSEPGEHLPLFDARPEIDHFGPMGLFDYARAKSDWYGRRKHDTAEGLGYLAEELDKYTLEFFGSEYPELVIQAKDVHDPHLSDLPDGSQRIAGELRQPNENTTILGEHKFNAGLRGFHVEDGALRVYVQHGDPLVAKTPAGLLVAFSSVAFDGSDIQFAVQKESDLRDKIGQYITEHVNEYDPRVRLLVQSLISTLGQSMEPTYRKLQLSSSIILEISKSDTSEQFLDTIMELVSFKLKLNSKVSLKTNSHRVRIPSVTTKAWKEGGPMTFSDILATPELIGDSLQPSLGLSFYHGKDVVTVPVHSITEMRRGE